MSLTTASLVEAMARAIRENGGDSYDAIAKAALAALRDAAGVTREDLEQVAHDCFARQVPAEAKAEALLRALAGAADD
jgi:hypothetical protein